ncbi:hypothetical protein ABKV19_022409 [Rosa sericea]
MIAQFSDSVVFRFFSTLFVEEEISPMRNSGFSSTVPERAEKSYEEDDDDDSEFFDVGDIESTEPNFVFKFEYQTREILKTLEKVDVIGDCVAFQAQKNSSSCFIEEAENGSAQKSNCDEEKSAQGFIEGFDQLVREVEVHEEKGDQGFRDGAFEEEEVVIEEDSVSDDEEGSESQEEVDVNNEEMSHSDEESDSTGDEKLATSHEDELVSEENFVSSESDSDLICSSLDDDEVIGLHKPDGFDEEDDDIMEQIRELEETDDQNSKGSELKGEEKLVDDYNGSEDSDTLDVLWEHQELIDQLKMELKKVRATTGLPTILEESESLVMDDLKPLKIDEKYQHGDRMRVLHKFYKSYRTRMRKLDILNYQKLYAIGVLQSKDRSFSSYKSSTPAIKSFLSNWRLCRPKIDCDPIVKFIKDVHSELEVVYVGQLCLSWEFLQWQYEKALELLKSAPNQIHSYNEVAEELQQFQVLLQRFIEDEHFRGARVENYVKNRCAMHKLLQVPVIREDKSEEGKKEDAITTDSLVEMLRESIRTIWRFIRADKNANITTACRKRSLDGDCLDPKLLVEVQADLRKKERKLKELLRSENRIIKRFQKHEEEEGEEEEDSGDHGHLNFFSQVDIRLVSRVLNMSTITQDQLVWCQSKLSEIHSVKRKIHVDPSFLLFPC